MSTRHRALEEHEEAGRIAAETTFSEALDHERDGWPDPRIGRAFWKRQDVPEDLRREHDPRETMTMPEPAREAWNAERDAWKERRLAWLEAATEGERT